MEKNQPMIDAVNFWTSHLMISCEEGKAVVANYIYDKRLASRVVRLQIARQAFHDLTGWVGGKQMNVNLN